MDGKEDNNLNTDGRATRASEVQRCQTLSQSGSNANINEDVIFNIN